MHWGFCSGTIYQEWPMKPECQGARNLDRPPDDIILLYSNYWQHQKESETTNPNAGNPDFSHQRPAILKRRRPGSCFGFAAAHGWFGLDQCSAAGGPSVGLIHWKEMPAVLKPCFIFTILKEEDDTFPQAEYLMRW